MSRPVKLPSLVFIFCLYDRKKRWLQLNQNNKRRSCFSGLLHCSSCVNLCSYLHTLTDLLFLISIFVTKFMCFVWIWEQTAIISLHIIDWLVFITETECVYCAVRSTFYILPTEYIYVFCVDLRKTAIISLYGIDYLVIITQTECV